VEHETTPIVYGTDEDGTPGQRISFIAFSHR
jgi:hypothetical protein